MSVWQVIHPMTSKAVNYGLITGGVYGTFMLFFPVGTIIGTIIGGSIGLFSGVSTGYIIYCSSFRNNNSQLHKIIWLNALIIGCTSFSIMFGISMLYYLKLYAVTPVSVGIGQILFWLPTFIGSVTLMKSGIRLLREAKRDEIETSKIAR